MKIAVISDIHANLPALEAVLADIARQQCDRIVDLGDSVSGPLWPADCFRLLKASGAERVRGNHDRVVAQGQRNTLGTWDRPAFDALAAQEREELGGLPTMLDVAPGVIAMHACPDDDLRYLLDDVEEGRLVRAPPAAIAERLGAASANIILTGHSHRADMVQLPTGVLIVNPGSVGCPAYFDPTAPAHVSEAGTPHARYAILELATSGQAAVTFRAIGYEAERAAACVDAQGQPRWAYALRTGRMPERGAP